MILMMLGVWPWLIGTTLGLAGVAWQFVFLCQGVALPFAVIGWSVGYHFACRCGMARQACAIVAGWVALGAAEVGLAVVLVLWVGAGAVLPGLWALPMLAILVTGGVLWFYRDATWVENER